MGRFEVVWIHLCFYLFFSKFSTFSLDFYFLCGQSTLMCVEAIFSWSGNYKPYSRMEFHVLAITEF